MRLTATLPTQGTAPGVARRFVVDALEATAVGFAVVETAELLTSELVTNAVIHAGSPAELSVSVSDGSVRVEVTDQAADRPVLRRQSVDATGGRGLVIVDDLADRWGVVQIPDDGKTVWFELRSGPHDRAGSTGGNA